MILYHIIRADLRRKRCSMARASGAAGLKSDRRLSLTSSGLTFEKNTKAYCGDREDREWGGRGRRGERERIRRSGARMKEIVYRQLSAAIMTICVVTRFISIPF